ncbi:MAG: squalene/phytoene synthase family protein [Magnetococcales bacterium]|nr:squalene/phytoene synthase family protein [Magnetococcales bacterium]NGZ07555.1 squalene/phytoene synthase family protein [Magnetococcales bacterium]
MKALASIPAHLAHDFAYCREVVLTRAEDAPLCARFLSRRIRPCWYVLCAFAWTARDFTRLRGGDDDYKLQLIDDWARRLEQARSGQADHPILRAMAYVLEETGLPDGPLQELLIACRMDVTNRRHGSLADLTDYCRFAAAPLGHLLLHLHHEMESTPEVRLADKLRHSDHFWTALWWTGFWRDLGHGSRVGLPLYLPDAEMVQFGVTPEMVWQRRFNPMLGGLMLYLVEETRSLFIAGAPLIEEVGHPFRLELAHAMERGMLLLDRIEACGGNTLRIRPELTQWERMACLWRTLGRS